MMGDKVLMYKDSMLRMMEFINAEVESAHGKQKDARLELDYMVVVMFLLLDCVTRDQDLETKVESFRSFVQGVSGVAENDFIATGFNPLQASR